MSFLRKIALMIPAVRRVRTDLHNRRIRADEFELANKAIMQRNEELTAQLDFMKTQMAKALTVKDTAAVETSALKANAEHYQSQFKVLSAKYDALKIDFQNRETEISILRLTNNDVIKKNAILVAAANNPVKAANKPVKKTKAANTARAKRAKRA